ncbi:MAG: M15 family metallopeptidase [Clostridia bacterium]|nr:M15 family metallopeptidase [Clostridia bacterium]
MPKRSLKEKLLDLRYYYTYGLFDLFRRGEKGLLSNIEPMNGTNVEFSREETLGLISASHPIKEDISEVLLPLDEKNAILPIAHAPMLALMTAAKEATGEEILFTSTYRTLAFQASIYGVNSFAARPGESEHHSGLCADIKVEGYAQRRFILSKTGKWVAKNAHRFGFIVRYPLWGQKKTGQTYEPWHLRYVGVPHAEIIYRSKITLEEYLDALALDVCYRFGEHVIVRRADGVYAGLCPTPRQGALPLGTQV